MGPENSSNNSIPEDRIGKVKDWGEMSSFLPPQNLLENEKFLRGYFRAQLLVESDKKVKAKRLFKALDNTTGYVEFEENNLKLLKLIDIAVRGESRIQF